MTDGIDRRQRKLAKELSPKRGERLMSPARAIEVCDLDAVARQIISKSTYTTHDKMGDHRAVRASNIINDFFDPEHFQGKTILEFGPGHYSFAMLARELGANVICVDRDPVFVQLGWHLGFRVIEKDFHAVTPRDIGVSIDGIWIKGAFNAARLGDRLKVEGFTRLLSQVLFPCGWGWCVTVNRVNDQDSPEGARRLDGWIETQRQCFAEAGWLSTRIHEQDRRRYALKYSGSRYFFTKNLPVRL